MVRVKYVWILLMLLNASSGQNDQVQQLFDEFFTWRMERSPEFSTLIGLKTHNRELETYTMDRFAEDTDQCNIFILRVEELKQQELTESESLNLEFLEKELQTFVDGFRFSGFFFPIK